MYLTPAFTWGAWEKLRNPSGRIRGAQSNILTNRVLPNTNVATAVSVYSVVMLYFILDLTEDIALQTGR